MINIKQIIIFVVLMFTTIGSLNAQLLYDDMEEEKENDWNWSGYRFNKLDINYYYANTTNDLSVGVQKAAIDQAFGLWCSNTPLTFTEVFSSSQADITILWATGDHGDGYPFDGPGNILAHAFLPSYSPYTGLVGDVHFDDDEVWVNGYSGDIDLVTVAAHEIGHSLGLKHSANPNALMYTYYTGPHRYLDNDDVDGIKTAYNLTSFTSAYTLSGTVSIDNFKHYKGPYSLQTSGSVTISGSGAFVSFKADGITLNPGFSVTSTSGSYFLATTDYDCILGNDDNINISTVEEKNNVNHHFVDESLPLEFSLSQNDPNPFNPVTTIRYSLPIDSRVSIKVYDMLGKEVATLVNGEKQAGDYRVDFNASNVASGIYFYRIIAGDFIKSYKMVVAK